MFYGGKIKMNKITSALFIYLLASPAVFAYTEDFKLEQEQLIIQQPRAIERKSANTKESLSSSTA